MKQKSKPNYVLKSYIIENHQLDLKVQKQLSFYYYQNNLVMDKRIKLQKIYGNDYEKINFKVNEFIQNELDNKRFIPFDSPKYEHLRLLDKILENDKEESFIMNECKKINDASYARTKRLENKITNMALTGKAIFLTLTFNDKVFEKMSDITRKRYIKQFLKENCISYIANIDFGKKNEREHYHAIVIPKGEKINNKNYYDMFYNSSIDFERLRNTNDYKAISKYVNKLTLHAIKETTRKNCVIYSRQ